MMDTLCWVLEVVRGLKTVELVEGFGVFFSRDVSDTSLLRARMRPAPRYPFTIVLRLLHEQLSR